ncbi:MULTISPECIES: LysM peptidoglycan-binding domain-containing protein [unclassified Mucilaginibacter]|uniref:LysM peptidoglycan-binding domain-containing protein n=1 Tax=unclassified Mucilaginibacter TaxID=2617802 RepID=UPI002AC94F89|nr:MULTISPECIES: LysM peptidoglycan-binding domain-containing protein [unclassified Mucilaginibacter]MEB0279602.1 LysM peptidoglycan-binding domain-containing protein [Mucilaginibacter sp. 10B2]MEB0300335.1 LysM peptidoglycan-binding domain-containing protein [Mucilaginibacter sp. 5C4]WPX22530.1 LysM peptidoglycan-binding domain-containing protein [Mucilaginibacter sp. 5C4]
MKFKILILSTVLLSISSTLFASALPDSVGVENLNGKKVILHKLDPKDNYYSLSRKYGVSPKVIQTFNNNAKMQIGQIIKVPTERSIMETTKPVVTAQAPVVQPQTKQVQQAPVATKPVEPAPAKTPVLTQQQPVQKDEQKAVQAPAKTPGTQEYKVSAHETLYSIAKRFNTTVEALTTLNKLKSTTLSPGQVLSVPNGTTAAPQVQPVVATDAHVDTVKRDSTYVASPIDSAAHKPGSNKYGLFEKNEKGVATWIDDASLDPNKKLVLHRTAPIGTVMRITNPMNNRTTFAKVVGRFTDSQSTKDAIVVMTKNVAEALGALDKRFHVNISYGTPNE